MKNSSTLLFCYGLELNLTLLHCIVAGSKPSCHGRARLLDHTMAWNVLGHFPNALPANGCVLEGALTRLEPQQLQRLLSSRLVPMLYRCQRRTVVTPQGRWRRALVFSSPDRRPSGTPTFSLWSEVVLGGLERGLPDGAIEALLAVRPNDRQQLLRRWSGPWPAVAPTPWILDAA